MVLILHGGRSVTYLSREPREGKHVLHHNFSELQKNEIFQIEKYSGSMRSIQKCIKTNQFSIGGSAGFFPRKCRQSIRLLLVPQIVPPIVPKPPQKIMFFAEVLALLEVLFKVLLNSTLNITTKSL